MQGRVKFFNELKGYGFIEPDNGADDVFVHANDVSGSRLICGDFVVYDEIFDPRKYKTRASNVTGGTGFRREDGPPGGKGGGRPGSTPLGGGSTHHTHAGFARRDGHPHPREAGGAGGGGPGRGPPYPGRALSPWGGGLDPGKGGLDPGPPGPGYGGGAHAHAHPGPRLVVYGGHPGGQAMNGMRGEHPQQHYEGGRQYPSPAMHGSYHAGHPPPGGTQVGGAGSFIY